MMSRGWKHKLAKTRGYEQSLFEHSLNEFDVLVELLPILTSSRHYNLSDTEQKILLVALLIHDAGKETEEWQVYVQNPRADRWISHIIPDLTRNLIPELCGKLGFEQLTEPVQRIMAHCVEFHHSRPGKSDGAIFEAMLTGGSDRFLTLAYLVRAIDHFCSAGSAAQAREAVEHDPALANHLMVAIHEAVVRGVSTTYVHSSSQVAFQQKGWRPLLYFSNATIYGADPNDQRLIPTVNEISGFLQAQIDAVISRDVTPLMVGSPTANILPKPDLFAFSESRQYLQSAGGKIGAQSFARAYDREKSRIVKGGSDPRSPGKGKTKADVILAYWKLVKRKGDPYSLEMDRDVARLSVAQPEMLVFKFFKAMVDPKKLDSVTKEGADLAKGLYEKTFGHGSWDALQSTSTLMPAKDMASTVDYFWALTGEAVNHPEVQKLAELPDQTRLQVLIDLLNGIAQEVYASVGRPSPRDILSQNMAQAFVKDIIRPSAGSDIRAFASEQLDHYCRSKPFAGKDNAQGIYLCPICNAPFNFNDGVRASADFIDSPQTHTNRGVACGPFGYIMVCTACYYERLLLQILLGSRPAEIITLLPRLNLGPAKGEQLVRKVREWVEGAKAQLRGESGNLQSGFSLGFTEQAARHLGDRDPFTLESDELLSLFSYRIAGDKQKEREQEAMRRLKEEFDNDLNALGVACGQSFSTWESVVEALIENQIHQQEVKAIRRDVFRLFETIYLICQTPNLILIPLTYEIASGKEEAETSKALRRLYVALILSLVFESSVAIHKQADPVDFQSGMGAAYVPPIPAVRSLIGHDWLHITEAKCWVAAIGAASMLVRDTGLPARSALYQVLAADPPEKLARRIEEAGSGRLTPRHLRLIEQLPGFRRAPEKEVSV